MVFLGCLDSVTEGILAGRYDGDEWILEVNSSFVLHSNASKDVGSAASDQEESPHGIPKFAEDAIVDYAKAVNWEMDGATKFKISPRRIQPT